MMKAGFSTPMLRVRDVDRSILFYEQLGFSLVDSEGKRAWVYERSTKFLKNWVIGKFPAHFSRSHYLGAPAGSEVIHKDVKCNPYVDWRIRRVSCLTGRGPRGCGLPSGKLVCKREVRRWV
jgi:hypothetical protein